MSLATLKKKTQSKYRNSSVGLQQFSLNGTRRLQGYIGQTSLSRSLPRTPAGGAYAKGHGGCCGTHPSDAAITSAVTNNNDSSVVKSSVLSSKGMLAKRLRCCDSVVKPDNQTSLNSSSSYLEYLKNKCSQIETYSDEHVTKLRTCTNDSDKACSSTHKDVIVASSQSDYLSRLKGKCLESTPEFQRVTNTCTSGRGACG